MTNPHYKLQGTAPDGRLRVDIMKEYTAGHWIGEDHLLYGPRMVHLLLPEATTQPVIQPRSVIMHTNGGANPATKEGIYRYNLSNPGVVAESHLQVDLNGMVGQFMPFNIRADCNYHANRWEHNSNYYGAIAIETADHGYSNKNINSDPWVADQLRAFMAILPLLYVCYDIQCGTPATWSDSGLGYHSQYPYIPGHVGCWTNVPGKVCPGRARINQMDWIRQQAAEITAWYHRDAGTHCVGTS